MTMRLSWRLACALFFLLPAPHVAAAQRDAWIATWATSPERADPGPGTLFQNLEDQTVRERVRLSIGGDRIRIRLSNEFGSSPLLLGSATAAVALPGDAASVRPGSVRTLTFGGHRSVTIPAGAPMLSDPLPFPAAYGTEISISLYFPQRVGSLTWHQLALRRAVVSPPGDHTGDQTIKRGAESPQSLFLTGVLVPAKPGQHLIVAFGDSIVDGDGSTLDADAAWPSALVRRLGKTTGGSKWAVVNEGIAGNRLLRDGPLAILGVGALARFDRDVLAQPGLTHIVLLEGINDVGFPGAKLGDFLLADPADARTAEDLIDAYRQLIARAHARGVRLIGATLTPCEGVAFPGYYSEAKEATRHAVNKWIRTSGAFDGVIDFDAVLRDPDHPARMLPRFASLDRLHPNDTGYQAMANAIDLALFR